MRVSTRRQLGERMIGQVRWYCAALFLTLLIGGCHEQRHRTVPVTYPRSYARIERDADEEGSLVVWSAIDRDKAASLVAAFAADHPKIHVSYVEKSAQQMYDQFRSAAAHHKFAADFMWSSAMDQQIKLVNDGYAQHYVSPESPHLPNWANWKDQAWGTTAEPIVMVYNRKMIPDAQVPRTHIALTRMLEQAPRAQRDLIATSDPETTAVGYLYLSQDAEASNDIWRLVRAMGAHGVRLSDTAEKVMHDVSTGQAAIGYNIVGSYALGEVRKNHELGMIIPRDYTLLMSRIAMIPAAAEHPNAARLFLDFVLSRRGQQLLADQNLPSIRDDVSNPQSLDPPDVPLRAIRVGPGLLVSQDQLTRRYFMKRWYLALEGRQVATSD